MLKKITFVSALLCSVTLISQSSWSQTVVDYNQAAVPSINGGYYGGGYYGGYGGYNPMMAQPIQQQPWMPYGAPQPPANTPPNQSAATPTQAFGLPPAAGQNQTVFGPPPGNYVNDSLPTTDHDTSTIHDNEGNNYTPNPNSKDPGTYTLDDLENPQSSFYGGNLNDVQTSRNQMIVNKAYRLGNKAGYAAEALRINKQLDTYAKELDKRYNFNRLKNGYIMPPVITVLDTTSQSCGINCLYLTTGSYNIASEAYVTNSTPSWRNYLFLSAPKVQVPRGIKLKKSKDKDLWKSMVNDGWKKGQEKAQDDLKEKFHLLNRDYAGMLRYYDLERQGAITMANVAIERKNGVIYVNGKTASKNETRVGLTISPRFENKAAVATSSVNSSDNDVINQDSLANAVN